MRFLHTSDWHVGKPLRNHKRDSEHEAALAEILEIAKREAIDCLLVAGDVFDSAVPTPEAERIVFQFFAELAGAGIPAVVIAGNHDHPRRWNAYAPVLRQLGIRVVGEPLTIEDGGVVEMPSRDKSETALIAALPWVSERRVRDFETLMADGRHFAQYAEGVGEMARHLGGAFRTDTINVFLAHLYISGAVVEQESGERALHVGDLYAVPPQLLPGEAHYLAMGHIHKPQKVGLNDTYYCGSLLQCDFGEAGQEKGVRIADLKPGRKAQTEFIPLTSIRRLMNLGTHKRGLTLDEIAAQADVVGEAYCKVFVKADRPVPGLVEQVRDLVPTAVDIVVERPEQTGEDHPAIERMTPAEQFAAYYQQLHANEPQPELISLFNRLFEEATGAAD